MLPTSFNRLVGSIVFLVQMNVLLELTVRYRPHRTKTVQKLVLVSTQQYTQYAVSVVLFTEYFELFAVANQQKD